MTSESVAMLKFACGIVLSIVCVTSAVAADITEIYRREKGSTRAVIETRLPAMAVKKCVLTKIYGIEFWRKKATTEVTKPVSIGTKTGETISWGDSESASIDITTDKGITTLSFFGDWSNHTVLPTDQRELPTQLFSYFKECFNDGILASNAAAFLDKPLYTLDTKASPLLLADCIVYATDARLGNPNIDAHVTRTAGGIYKADFFRSYDSTGERLVIGAGPNGTQVLWTRAADKAFLVIKLEDPAKLFDKDTAERSHPILSKLKACANIGDGTQTAIKDFPKPPTPEDGRKALDGIYDLMAAQYRGGEIEMAEMPLEISGRVPFESGVTFNAFTKKDRPQVPVRYLDGAVLVQEITDVGKKRNENFVNVLPLVYVHSRSDVKAKSKEQILENIENHVYCDETTAFSIRALNGAFCYSDSNNNGFFDKRRIAILKLSGDFSNIYHIGKSETITPIRYRKSLLTEFSDKFLRIGLYNSWGNLRVCPYYAKQDITYINVVTFCYASLERSAEQSVSDEVSFSGYGIKLRLSTPLSEKSIVRSFEHLPQGTIVGKIEPREPVKPFGQEPLWIDQFSDARNYLRLRDAQLSPGKIQKSFVSSGTPGSLIVAINRDPIVLLKVRDVKLNGNQNWLGIIPGQTLAGFNFSFDRGLFEPARLFACGMTRNVVSTTNSATFCFVADRPTTSVYFNFPGKLTFIPTSYTSSVNGPTVSVEPATASDEQIWSERLYFDSWTIDGNGADVARFTVDSFYVSRPVGTEVQNALVKDGVAEHSFGNYSFKIRKAADGGFAVFDVVEKVVEKEAAK